MIYLGNYLSYTVMRYLKGSKYLLICFTVFVRPVLPLYFLSCSVALPSNQLPGWNLERIVPLSSLPPLIDHQDLLMLLPNFLQIPFLLVQFLCHWANSGAHYSPIPIHVTSLMPLKYIPFFLSTSLFPYFRLHNFSSGFLQQSPNYSNSVQFTTLSKVSMILLDWLL